MRVWIEIFPHVDWATLNRFHPLMRVWIEIISTATDFGVTPVSPSYEGVD